MGQRLDAWTFGRRRRARRMRRRLEQLDRQDARLRAAGLDPLEVWRRSRDPRAPIAPVAPIVVRSPRRVGPAVLAVLLAAAVTGLTAWQYGLRGGPMSYATGQRPDLMPPAGVGERPARIGEPVPAPAGAGGYAFEATQSDRVTPVTWDPCRPIHYVLSGTAPAGAADLLSSAVAEVSRLTGFQFIADGATTEPASENRPAYQPGRYGRRWAPVLIAWTSPQQIPALAGATIGLGGGTAIGWTGHPRSYVSGTVYLDAPQYAQSLARADGHGLTRAVLHAVVLHELGHLLGLAHVTATGSVMYPEASLTATDYSAGDRRGLHTVSEGRCAPEL